jgi:hypothetical protein
VTIVQYAVLLFVVMLGFGAVILTMLWAVEKAISVRWKSITSMFDRALMHGGSLDTLSRQLREDSAATKELASDAVEVAGAFKGRLDDHARRIAEIENHPFLRKLGGGKVGV